MPPDKRKSVTPAPEPSSEWMPYVHAWKTETIEWLEIHLPGVEGPNAQGRIEGRTLTVEGHRRIPTQHELVPFSLSLDLPSTYSIESREARFDRDVLRIKFLKATAVRKDGVLTLSFPETPDPTKPSFREAARLLGARIPEPAGVPFSIDIVRPTSATIPRPEHQFTDETKMVEDDYALQLGRILAQKAITKAGTRYFPLSLAAPLAQAPETTLRDWITKKTKFAGRAIHTHTSPTAGIYISEESVNRMACRFIKWPSQQPAGRVTIGETDDQSGYIGLTDAARMVGVERHTIWRWATKGTSPTERTLDVIKCPASEQFYISEKDVESLKSVVPRSGLRRGPRSHLTP
jgi:HSP20 family molecular chaperone IbpA